MPIPPLTPTPESKVAVTAMHPFRMLPPLSHVVVIGLLDNVGIVTRFPRLEVGTTLLIPLKLVGMVRGSDSEGVPTSTPAPIVTDTPSVALTLSGMLGTREVKPGKADIKEDAPSSTAPGT
jgi:hypothetical protein